MNKDLNWLKKQIKEREVKNFEADNDRVFNSLIEERLAFTAYKEIADPFRDDKDFIVDSVIADEHGAANFCLSRKEVFIYRIRYIK